MSFHCSVTFACSSVIDASATNKEKLTNVTRQRSNNSVCINCQHFFLKVIFILNIFLLTQILKVEGEQFCLQNITRQLEDFQVKHVFSCLLTDNLVFVCLDVLQEKSALLVQHMDETGSNGNGKIL